MLETAIDDGAVKLFFEKEISKTCGLNCSICAQATMVKRVQNLLLGFAINLFFLIILVWFREVELVEVTEFIVLSFIFLGWFHFS